MTKPFEPKATLDEMSRYLTEVDGYLLSLLKDQSTRLDHIEEIAQVLISSGADPVEEFGPAEEYANELANAVGRTSMPSWVRVVLAAAGGFLFIFGLFTVHDLLVPLFFGGTYYAQTVLLDPTLALSGLFASAAALEFVSPKAQRFQSKLFRTSSPFAVSLLMALFFFIFPSVKLPDAVFIEFSLPSPLDAAAIVSLFALAGYVLLHISGLPRLIVARYRNRRRPSSVFQYGLSDGLTRVRLLRPTDPTLGHPHLQ